MRASLRKLKSLSLVTVLVCTLTAPAFAESGKTWGPYSYERVKLADNVYGFFETKMHSIVSGNVIAVIGKDGVLVFDTGHHPPMAYAIAEEIRRISDKPVRYIVVSHWHDDHWVGNAEFASVFPGAQVVAHPFTAEMIAQRAEKFAGAPCKAELENQVKPMRDQLAGGKKADGSPLPDDARRKIEEEVSAYDEQIRECTQKRFHGVDLTFDSAIKIQLGEKEVDLLHLGRANTAGDVVAFLPNDRILLTGDIVVFPFPFSTQSYITEWAAVLHKLDAMDPEIIVPGHGAAMYDKHYLEDLATLFESLSTQARAVYKPGMSADELRGKIDFSAFSDKFSHGDRFIKLNFDYMIGQPAVDRLWQELSGQWTSEGD